MKQLQRIFLVLAASLILSNPSLADAVSALSCKSTVTVDIENIGPVGLARLQDEIVRVEEKLIKLAQDGRRGSRIIQRVELKRKLRNLTRASHDLHEKMFYDGCKKAIRGASLETQLRVLEEHLGMM